MARTTDITITQGAAVCHSVRDGREETPVMRATQQGASTGAGLFAIEFRPSGGSFEYVLKFDCPSPNTTATVIDYIAGTSSTGTVPGVPAEWRHASLAADPQPAMQIGMDLIGVQTDLRGDPTNDVAGQSRVVWSLKR